MFALADYGDWASRAPILLEPHSLRGDTAPSRETEENTPRVPARSIGNGGTHGGAVECANAEGSLGPPFLTASNLAKCVNNQTFLLVVHGTQDPDIKEDLAHTLGCNNGQENAITYAVRTAQQGANGIGVQQGLAYTLDLAQGQAVALGFAQNTRDEVRLVGGSGAISGALSAQPGMKQTTYAFTYDGFTTVVRLSLIHI